jgi:hypothetical protein
MQKAVEYKTIWLFLAMILAVFWTMAISPAAAQGPGAPMLEKPQPTSELPGPGEKKDEAPTTCGPLISDSCIPIEEHHASIQVLGALSLYTGNFSPNWRTVSANGNLYTFQLPVKFTYGPTKNLETYIIVPFIKNWVNHANETGPDGNASASYAGIGDITAVAKYNFHPEGDICPAMTAVGGIGVPTGHASHLNLGKLGQDAIGTGSVNLITGINLYKWLKPFLVYSNIWLNSPINVYKERGDFDPQPVRNRENVTFNLAAEYPINKQWILLLEMYSTWTWSNPTTESIGFQSPTTVVGFLPGIEYFATEKIAFSAGAAFDTFGKFGGHKVTPALTMYYSF